MANIPMTGFRSGPPVNVDRPIHPAGAGQTGHGFGAYANAAGALVSMALLVGVGVWSYNILMRDVSGVPVVRASAGPWRAAPENPGGQAAQHQGLAVNEVAGSGRASGPAEKVALAPRSLGLEATDMAGHALAADAARSKNPERRLPGQDAAIQALADQIAAGAKPLRAADSHAGPQAATQIIAIDAPGPRLSLRPRVRPAQLVQASVRAAAVLPFAQVIDSESLPSGTQLVQLGAYDSAALARQAWDRITGKLDRVFEGKAPVIQLASGGGRTFFRLRAHGFADLDQARRFCALLISEGPDCIPVSVK